MDLGLLRDRTRMTELAVLFALKTEPGVRLTAVADRLDVTVQAVSNYARSLAEQDLLVQDDGTGTYRVTPAGVEALHDRVAEVKRAVDDAYRRLSVITETAALAGAAIQQGDRLGLVLEEGVLVAYPDRDSPSTGIAATAAAAGEVVAVSDLEGILDIRPGHVHLVRVPADAERARALDPDDVARRLKDRGAAFDRVAGLGTEAKVLARRMDRPLLEFAPVEAAFEAAQLGLDVLLLATADQLKSAVTTLESRNEDAPLRVRYTLHEDAVEEASEGG